MLAEFVAERLPLFGDYQDLMLTDSPTMFHSIIAGPLNLGLLLPMECVDAAVRAYESGHAPLAAVEGFVRQIIGWREFVNGVYWLKMPDYLASNGLGATRPLPAFFYSADTEMNCLRRTIKEVRHSAFNHHIQRLMILGNFCLLAGISPQAAHDWFLEMYVDAHEWVMAANVLGMALHADGGFMATKPYALLGLLRPPLDTLRKKSPHQHDGQILGQTTRTRKSRHQTRRRQVSRGARLIVEGNERLPATRRPARHAGSRFGTGLDFP